MKKLTIHDAAIYLGVSKEAIHNRIRRGSIEYVMEGGIKKVLIPETAQNTQKRVQRTAQKSSVDNQFYHKLLQEQNGKLESKVELLEAEVRILRDQKEQMLIAEREKIEHIYKEKDEQLKNILSTISSQFTLSAPEELIQQKKEQQVEAMDAEIEEEPQVVLVDTPISLKKYLKSMDFSEKKLQKIKAKFKKRAKKDMRILTVGSKIYLHPTKYNYKDLL